MTKINAEGTAAGRPCIYVGNYVSFYIDKKIKLWHLEKQGIEKYEA